MSQSKQTNIMAHAEAALELLRNLSDQELYIKGNLDMAEYLANEAQRLKYALERIKNHCAYRQDWLILRDKVTWYEKHNDLALQEI